MKTYQELKAALPRLSDRDRTFAQSLLDGFDTWARFSAKQQYWVDTLCARATGNTPAATKVNLTGVVALFRTAQAHGLRRPSIRLMTDTAGELRMSLAAENSRNPGFVYVKRNGVYMGKVSPQGDYLGDDAIAPALTALGDDPAKTAAAHGHRTGNCCFCGLQLTDGRSIEVGYGPICADHYGLPWGEVRAETRVDIEGAVQVAPLATATETPKKRARRPATRPLGMIPTVAQFVTGQIDPELNDDIGF